MNPVQDTGAEALVLPQREERRSTALAGWLVRNGSDTAHDFVLTDLSYGGCRLRTEAPLARGDLVKLTILSRGAIPAVVRWRNGQGVGLSFVVEPQERVQKPRQAERLPIAMSVIVRRAGRRGQSLDASDISRKGCCLAFVDPPRAGDLVWISLPGLEPIESRVRWVEGHRAGVEFVQPIHEAVFDLLLLRWNIRRA